MIGFGMMGAAPVFGKYIAIAGMVGFGATVFFQLINLPVEFDASNRAKKLCVENGIVMAQEREGIDRAGYFVMPMDETLAVAAIDLGGRPHTVTDLKVKVRLVGDLQLARAGALGDEPDDEERR